MKLQDPLSLTPVYPPDARAAAEEKILVYFEQLFLPEVLLIPYLVNYRVVATVRLLTLSRMSVVKISEVTPPVRSSIPSPPYPPSMAA